MFSIYPGELGDVDKSLLWHCICPAYYFDCNQATVKPQLIGNPTWKLLNHAQANIFRQSREIECVDVKSHINH